MIQPDGKTHCVHMCNELGIFREPELEGYYDVIQASSPALCIHPGFKIYLIFVEKELALLLEKSAMHGYPQTLSIEVEPTTGQPFSCSLYNITSSYDIQCDSGTELKFIFMTSDALPIQASNNFYSNTLPIQVSANDFYLNIKITDIS